MARAQNLPLNELALRIVAAYPNKDLSHVTDMVEVDEIGDTLFQYCVYEAQSSEDMPEFLDRLSSAMSDLQELELSLLQEMPG